MSTAPQTSFTPDFAVTFSKLLIERLDKEATATRRVIGNIPEDKRDYRPAPNSRSAWELAHVPAARTAGDSEPAALAEAPATTPALMGV